MYTVIALTKLKKTTFALLFLELLHKRKGKSNKKNIKDKTPYPENFTQPREVMEVTFRRSVMLPSENILGL